jgi:hypothetical protein
MAGRRFAVKHATSSTATTAITIRAGGSDTSHETVGRLGRLMLHTEAAVEHEPLGGRLLDLFPTLLPPPMY